MILTGSFLKVGYLKIIRYNKIYIEILSEEFINEDLKKLKDLGVNICLNSVFDKSQLDKYKENYDVIIIDGNIYDENLDYDEITLQYENNIFYMTKNSLSIECVGLGKRVSTSIDRFFQNSSMTEGREREGSFETRLYTNLDGIEIEQEI